MAARFAARRLQHPLRTAFRPSASPAVTVAATQSIALQFSRTRWYTPPPPDEPARETPERPWVSPLAADDEATEAGQDLAFQQFQHYLTEEGAFAFDLGQVLPHHETIAMGRHTNVTTGGKVLSFSALVIVGNGEGTGAVGYGKGRAGAFAVTAATRDAYKNLVTINRYEGRTIPYDISLKYRASKIELRTLPKGSGLRGHGPLRQFAEMLGLEDMSIKTYRSKNLRNLMYGFLYGLQKEIRDPEMIARGLGYQYVNMNKVWRPRKEEHKIAKPSPLRKGFYDRGTLVPVPRRISSAPAPDQQSSTRP